jgi:hypothetical protein
MSAAETSANPPALAVKKEARPPMRSGRYVTSGVTTSTRGLLGASFMRLCFHKDLKNINFFFISTGKLLVIRYLLFEKSGRQDFYQ